MCNALFYLRDDNCSPTRSWATITESTIHPLICIASVRLDLGGNTLEYLWAPWRMEYILSEKPTGCLFCTKLTEKKDEDNFILYRGKTSFIIINYYPYNNGHLMIVPYRHISNLSDLSAEENSEMMSLVGRCESVLRQAMNPDGFNIGMNLGKVAGAGVEDHIHFHIVPRWNGDTNFMPVVGHTKVSPQGLRELYLELKIYFE